MTTPNRLIRSSFDVLQFFCRIVWGVVAILGLVQRASAQIDSLEVVVDTITATNGNPIAAFGYNPTDDLMFVSSFGAGGALRQVTDVSGSPTSEIYVSEAQLQLFYRDGDPDRGVSTPLQSSILFNPAPLGAGDVVIPAYGMAVFADNGFTRLPASTTTDPAATKRFYSYNLQRVNVPSGPGEFGDGRDVFTTLATLADMQSAIEQTTTSSNQGRQFAWSGDGQRIYFADSSSAFGGLWTLDPVSGGVARLAAEDDFNTELAVIATGGVDGIYVRGGGLYRKRRRDRPIHLRWHHPQRANTGCDGRTAA